MLSRCFIEMDGAVDEWARGDEENVLFVDATFNTNCAGLHLVAFVTVGSTGQTVVLAVGLLRGQDYQSYEWLFRRYHDVFKVKPRTMYTDSAPELDLAIVECSTIESDIWYGITHHLCIFHLSQNVFDNCRKAFGTGQTEQWRKMIDEFWRMAKNSDVRGKISFDSDFHRLVMMVVNALHEAGVDDPDEHPAVKWLLTTLYPKREKWAACYTWGTCSWGAHSTQRSESWNRTAKLDVNKHTRVTELVKVLDKKNKTARDDQVVHDIRAAIRQSASRLNELPAFLHTVANKLTPYAADLLKAQLAHYASGESALFEDADPDLDEYQVTRVTPCQPNGRTPTTNEDGTFRSWQADEDFGLNDSPVVKDRMSSKLCCSCQYPTCYRLPCRHELALWIRHQQIAREALQYPIDLIGSKWIVLSEQEQAEQTHRLRTTDTTRPIFDTGVSGGPTFISPAARYPLLMAEFRSVAQLGALNMKNVSYVREALAELIKQLSLKPAGTDAAGPDAVDFTASKKKATGKDAVSLMERLGTSLEPVPKHDALPIITAGLEDGVAILLKYDKKKSGNWVSCVVHAQESAPQSITFEGAQLLTNHDVVYDGEVDRYDSVYLGVENYMTDASAARWCWMLLRNRPAGASDAEIAQMTLPSNKPKGSAKRKKPNAERSRRRR